MLDFSHKTELRLHAEIAADINAALAQLGARATVIGAFARDLHLHHGAGIPVQRSTEDVDFAIALRDWREFDVARNKLISSRAFQEVAGKIYRLRHRSAVNVDLVPFGGIENKDRHLEWPPDGGVVMDVYGFQEALAATEDVLLPGGVSIQVVSLPALALLKLVAWEDRHQRTRGKDAPDLMLIARHYLDVAGNKERLWSEFPVWTSATELDVESVGARLLGHDIRDILDSDGVERMAALLCSQIDDEVIGALPLEMNRHSPEQARSLLQEMLTGIDGSSPAAPT